MIAFPNAKINLGLNITARRPDGYHDLESCFIPVGWCDALEIVPADEFAFSSSGIDIPGSDKGHLCEQAYLLLKEDHDLPPVKIHLHKNIPIGAGLGGGSADCAFALKILNQLFELGLETAQLQKYAGMLGSDCPFFIDNAITLATGTGTTFKKIPLDLSAYYIQIVYPQQHISTGEAYSVIQPAEPERSVETILLNDSIETWKNNLVNDYEKPLFDKYPDLASIKNRFYEKGAVYASMTGSGSAIYGIFDSEMPPLFPEYPYFSGRLAAVPH